MADFSATHHHLSNISLRFEDDGSVRGVSYIYAWHRRSGDEPDQHLWGEYHDRFVRTPDGWRIAERTLRSLFVHGEFLGPDQVRLFAEPAPR